MKILLFFSLQDNCWQSANEASYYTGMFTVSRLQAKFIKRIQTITFKTPVTLKKIPQWHLTHPLPKCKLVLQVIIEFYCKESCSAGCRSALQTHRSVSDLKNPICHHIPLRVNHSKSQLLALGGSPCSAESSTGWNKEGKTELFPASNWNEKWHMEMFLHTIHG